MKLTRRSMLILLGIGLCACASQPDKAVYESFIARRAICDHLRGEFTDPPDPARSKEILDGTKKYCSGTDVQLKELKRLYAKDPDVMNILKFLEEDIE